MKNFIYCLTGFLFLCFIHSCSKKENNEIINPTNPTYRLTLTGSVKNCTGTNITNGYLFIVSKYDIFSVYISNGSFDTTFESTNTYDSLMTWAIDLNSLKTSDTIFRAVNTESISLGIINTCSNVDEYLDLSIDNEKFTFVPVFYDSLNVGGWDTLSAPTTYFYRADLGNLLYKNKFHRMQFNGMTAGNFGVNWNSSLFIDKYYSFNMPSSGNITYTSYGNIGDFITGTLNIPFIDNTDSLNHLMTGSFKVRRDY